MVYASYRSQQDQGRKWRRMIRGKKMKCGASQRCSNAHEPNTVCFAWTKHHIKPYCFIFMGKTAVCRSIFTKVRHIFHQHLEKANTTTFVLRQNRQCCLHSEKTCEMSLKKEKKEGQTAKIMSLFKLSLETLL